MIKLPSAMAVHQSWIPLDLYIIVQTDGTRIQSAEAPSEANATGCVDRGQSNKSQSNPNPSP